MRNLLSKSLLASCAAIALSASVGSAATVSFDGSTAAFGGTGFGNVLNLLTVQNNNSEWGTIGWDGTQETRTGNAKPNSSTRTVATLQSNGIAGNDLGIVFNMAQTGSSDTLNLKSFGVRFYAANGSTLFDAVFTPGAPNSPTNALTVEGQGTGSSGYLFVINLSQAEITQFYANPANRMGMFILQENAITGSNGGQENFYIGKLSELSGGPTPIPLPTSALAGGALLLPLFARRTRQA